MVQLSLIEAHERTIGRLFSDEYAFEVPAYQRPYAWEEEQVRELLADLFDAMENTPTSGGVYFLGSVVLIKSPTDPRSRIVDGQQRLTTLTILLSILRDLTAENEVRISRRSYVFQKANPDSGTEDRYRVLLRTNDRAFFAKHIQLPGATDAIPDPFGLKGSQRRIAENATYLRRKLEPLDDGKRNALVAFLIQRCYVVVVAVPTAESARRIFTVLNARGLDLTPTDILKANLLERANRAQELDLANRWEQIEQEFGRDKMVELFGHIRMIFERDKPRIALEDGFPKHVTHFGASAEGFVSNLLEPIADAAAFISNSQAVKAQLGSEAAKAVRSLDRVDNKDWLPPALLRIWKRKSGDHEAVANFLICLERLTYYLFVTRADVNARIERFAGVMDEFDPRPNRPAISDRLLLSRMEQWQFLLALSGPLYLKTRVCKPVLQRLDEALSTGGASYDELVSIEHVLPQTVEEGSEWAALFPTEAIRQEWVHKLANLVFLTRRVNIKASNWDFEKKKSQYFASDDGSSPFVLTQGVLQTKLWNAGHLIERQRKLLFALSNVWALEQQLADDPRLYETLSKAPIETISLDESEGVWRNDVFVALEQLGGSAHLEAIYDQVSKIRKASGRTEPASLRSLVRKNLEENSSDSKAFKGKLNIFRLDEKGSGLWAIRQARSDQV
jgi:hypothetical protein